MINIIVLIIFIISVYYTFKYKFVQFKCFRITKEVLKNSKSKKVFSTFMVSLANHIGVGNVVGITSAIIVGGAGSLFWMWIFAIFSSIFSIIENTIAQDYKYKIDNETRGGSPFYIKNGLGMPFVAIIIAIFLTLSNSIFFQPLQINTISESLFISFNIPLIVSFMILSLFFIFIIFKGTKKIVKFCEIIVPIMSFGYIILGITIIIINYNNFFKVVKLIVEDAFNLNSVLGGCVFVGFKKSLFSHEAGLGTAPSISVMSDVNNPLDQGFISCFGVFFDTLIICSITGFMILLNNIDLDITLYSGCDLIIVVFKSIFGKFGIYLATFFMISFALATVVSQYYLGETNLMFIIKECNIKKIKLMKLIFQIIFIIGIFIGVFLNIESIWSFVDTGMILLGIINIFSIIKLNKKFDQKIKNYFIDNKY